MRLIPTSRRLWLAYCAADAAIYVTVFVYFHGLESHGAAQAIVPVLVLVRTIALFAFVRRATGTGPVPVEPANLPIPRVAA